MTMTALMLIAFCSGNMYVLPDFMIERLLPLKQMLTRFRIGPQIFGLAEAPRYRTAFDLVSVSYGFACLSSLGLRAYMNSINQRWDDEERLEASLAEGSERGSHPEAGEAGVRSLTAGFRYWLWTN
jgi:hypothetical protein